MLKKIILLFAVISVISCSRNHVIEGQYRSIKSNPLADFKFYQEIQYDNPSGKYICRSIWDNEGEVSVTKEEVLITINDSMFKTKETYNTPSFIFEFTKEGLYIYEENKEEKDLFKLVDNNVGSE